MGAVPSEMAFIRIDRPGPPEVLVPDRMAVPKPGPGEVLIKVAAAGINRPDVLQRARRLSAAAGRLRRAGPRGGGRGGRPRRGCRRAGRSATGSCALVSSGGYAEYCIAPAPQVLPVPAGMSGRSRRQCPRRSSPSGPTCSTAAGCSAGESLLVHGGSSGIGTTAIQLAHAFGATVFATVGGAEKQRACEALGAKRAIDYRNEDFVAVVARRDRRPRRRRDPRHGRRPLCRAQPAGARGRGPAGADRLAAGRQGRRPTSCR